MPVDHSKHKFLEDIGTDWVALGPTGAPLSRAATEAGVRRAVPDAASYINGGRKARKSDTVDGEQNPAPAVEPVSPEPVAVEPVSPEPVAVEPVTDTTTASADPLDHDGDGKKGGSPAGENATASKSRRQRKPAAK